MPKLECRTEIDKSGVTYTVINNDVKSIKVVKHEADSITTTTDGNGNITAILKYDKGDNSIFTTCKIDAKTLINDSNEIHELEADYDITYISANKLICDLNK